VAYGWHTSNNFLLDGRLNDDVKTTGVDGDNYEASQNWNALGSNYDIDLDNNKLSRH
jgi:hypothetical protein